MMKSVTLKGIKITIGDKVRFIDDSNLYVGCDINKPELGKIYEVSGFSVGANGTPGFYLVGVDNDEIAFSDKSGDVEWMVPGFAIWRFDPATPLADSISAINSKEVEKVLERVLERVLISA